MKKILMGVAALCVASASHATVIDDFSGDLSNYTMTRILNNSGGTNDLAGVINSEALDFTSTAHSGAADQYAFIYNGLSLAVNEEVQVDISWAKTMTGTGSSAVGLYVGKPPVNEVREDYVSVYLNGATDIKARGFNGTSELGNATATGAATALFISRIAATNWEVGYYVGATRNVITTRTGMDAANDGSAVGFYIDTRGIGSIGTMDNLATNAITVDPVTAEIDASTTSGLAPLEVVFSGESSTAIEPIASYNWDFGDGNSATGSVVTNTYVSSGTYTAELTVVDTLSNSNSMTIEINAIAEPVEPVIILMDDFTGVNALDNWTSTAILDDNGGSPNTSAFQVNGSDQLELNTSSYDGVEQYAFIRTGAALAVGEEAQVTLTIPITGSDNNEALGLYVGGTAPSTGVREDYITSYSKRNSNNAWQRGFDGTTEYGNPNTSAVGADTLFIARTAENTFEVGFYIGVARSIVTTRTPTTANSAEFVGIYADARAAGTIGSIDSFQIIGPEREPLVVGDISIDVISAGTEVTLSFLTSDGGSYGVAAQSSLTSGIWNNIITNIAGTGSEVTVTNPITSGPEFYRAYLED